MAGKKKEGTDALKEVSGGKRREDRNAYGKTFFDPISIDAGNALTVIYLLKSPEENVALRAIASLEGFAKKDIENLKILCSLGISEYLLPLIGNPDFIVRRFTLKLIAMLSSLEEFCEKLLQIENVLETFTSILSSDPDELLQEFASLTLANLSTDYGVASELLKSEDFISSLFEGIRSSDPDIEKNCLEIMKHLLNDINGIEAFVETSGFDVQPTLQLIYSSYPVIQALALEVLTQLTSWCRDNRILIAVRDASGIEKILSVLEKEEWPDLHIAAVGVLVNITDNPEMCDYLYRSGCLLKLVNLLDNITKKTVLEKILGILARLSQSSKARPALHSVNVENRFIAYVEEPSDSVQESSCLGLANQSQYFPSLETIVAANPIESLISIITNPDKSSTLRNMAAYTLNVLSNADERVAKILLKSNNYVKLLELLKSNTDIPMELSQNLIRVLIGISSSEHLRSLAVSEELFKALLNCLPDPKNCIKRDVCLQVDALECTSEFLIEPEAQVIFNSLNGVDVALHCLCSKFASVREWAGHLVLIASQSEDFVKTFIRKNGLQWMLKEKNTMYSMPSWQSAIENIFNNFLPAKFAFTGRLDFHDITKDGFYIITKPSGSFIELQHFLEEKICPVVPVYVASFETQMENDYSIKTKSTNTSVSVKPEARSESQNFSKFMKGADRDSQEDFIWEGSLNTYSSVDYNSVHVDLEYNDTLKQFFPDTFLIEHLENLKKKIEKEELRAEDSNWLSLYRKIICQRAKIIAEFVADEMSGPEPDPICSVQYKLTQINEIKHFLGSNIIPLGLIRMGDYLERAMLFKVLADRIGFSCALVRGPYGRAWIEIALPVINIDDSEEEIDAAVDMSTTEAESYWPNTSANKSNNSCECKISSESTSEDGYWFMNLRLKNFKGFPTYYLKPNAIIDLVNDPGRILNINSYEAKKYCGSFVFDEEKKSNTL